MYYELIILGTLMSGPFHGYLIAKIMQNILGPYGQLSKGRLYPLLTKLEEAGLIMVEQVSEQQEKLSVRRLARSAFFSVREIKYAFLPCGFLPAPLRFPPHFNLFFM